MSRFGGLITSEMCTNTEIKLQLGYTHLEMISHNHIKDVTCKGLQDTFMINTEGDLIGVCEKCLHTRLEHYVN